MGSKKTWTRKLVLVTDGENPIEVDDEGATARKIKDLDIAVTVVCVRCVTFRVILIFHQRNRL